MKDDGHMVYVSKGDADTLIAAHALELSLQRNNVVVISDDTDVLVLLTYHWNKTMEDIYFFLKLERQ